jgi:hypothetical protein
MQCGFKSFGQIAALDIIDGGDATGESLCNLRRRHFAIKEMENPSACLQTVGSFTGAEQSFQRTAFFVRELNELCVLSHCRKIAVATAIYNNFNYTALAISITDVTQ